MSHHLISKKLWASMLTLMVMFCALTYAWFYYTNQWVLQTEQQEREEHTSVVAQEVAEPMVKPIDKKSMEVSFPCTLQLKEGLLGLYDEQGELCRELHQIGEYLNQQDRMQLLRGISVEDQQQLISLCESYHLQ